jgi:hypothetical protein
MIDENGCRWVIPQMDDHRRPSCLPGKALSGAGLQCAGDHLDILSFHLVAVECTSKINPHINRRMRKADQNSKIPRSGPVMEGREQK